MLDGLDAEGGREVGLSRAWPGTVFSTGEIAGPIVSFVVLGA